LDDALAKAAGVDEEARKPMNESKPTVRKLVSPSTTVFEASGSNANIIERQRIEAIEPIQCDDWTAADLLPMDTTL
jgi:hypothetical protein